MPQYTADTVPYPPGPDPEHYSHTLAKPPRSAAETLRTALYVLIIAFCMVSAALLIFLSVLDLRFLYVVGFFVIVLVGRWLYFRNATATAPHSVDAPPGLTAFVARVADDAGARPPRSIRLVPGTDAAVTLDDSLANLWRSPRYELTLGLGLLNVVNLSELQAILAHEMSHAAHRLWGRGLETTMLQTLVRTRWLRNALQVSRRQIVREREFRADNLAAAVAGSPASLHALVAAAKARVALNDAIEELRQAAEHQLFSDDIYYHQLAAINRMSGFAVDDDASGDHPTHAERVKNLEAANVPAAIDERTSWLLFDDPAALRQQLSAMLMRAWPEAKNATLKPARVVQHALDAERADVAFDLKYQGVYDRRHWKLKADDIVELEGLVRHDPWTAERVKRVRDGLYDDGANRSARRAALAGQRERCIKRITMADGREALDRIADFDARLAAMDAWFHALDRRVVLVHLQMAISIAVKYKEYLVFQERAAAAETHAEQCILFGRLAPPGKLADAEIFKEYVNVLRLAQAALQRLDPASAIDPLPAGPLPPKWIDSLNRRLARVRQRTEKKRAEALASLLVLQDQVAAEYFATADLLAAVEA